ncbi:uncharacterized protein N7482_010484 [Penicillium canariense]|uniref:Uncharacterized protein n=1 Tax=Penicillium canariense TaxID=189055 RepID=A0A9W9HKU2_9EURO|nr:uncharacterized protein N7482_010484 [Penicillium canariense]KAJ5151232.1 hypothetical protein N7482_010484 [Penicillium canariense]
MHPRCFVMRMANRPVTNAHETQSKRQPGDRRNQISQTGITAPAHLSVSCDGLEGTVSQASTKSDGSQPTAAREQVDSSRVAGLPITPPKSQVVDYMDDEEPPRSLKRKRKPSTMFLPPRTPESSPRSAGTPSSEKAYRKVQSLSLNGPITDAHLTKRSLPRLRSEARKAGAESENDIIATLRHDLDALRSDFESERRAHAELRSSLEEMTHMNDTLRMVIRGDRIYSTEMYTKLQSLRKKLGPLLAKVDTLQEAIGAVKTQFGNHDAPVELIMDFTKNFYQWWIGRLEKRREGGEGHVEDRGAGAQG